MSGQRADSRRDSEIAAAYASGLSDRGVAAKFGIGRGAVRGAVKRTGTPFREPGVPRKLAGEAGAATAALYAAGHSARMAAREAGVSPMAALRAVRQYGTGSRSRSEAARLRREREARERGDHLWAAEAAARHRAGVPVGRLAREYGVAWRAMRGAIERQGVTITPGPRGRPAGTGKPQGGAA
ncbi:MAG TPA: hypothetical protein VK586_02895 [Streptosporangiaceae bacterium]|nr:hypothetical protein [Streptosporangiaceae bacterium]